MTYLWFNYRFAFMFATKLSCRICTSYILFRCRINFDSGTREFGSQLIFFNSTCVVGSSIFLKPFPSSYMPSLIGHFSLSSTSTSPGQTRALRAFSSLLEMDLGAFTAFLLEEVLTATVILLPLVNLKIP